LGVEHKRLSWWETERQRDREGQRDRGTEGQRDRGRGIEKHQVRSRLVELRGERRRKNREENTIMFFCKGWLRGLKPMP